MFDPHQTLVAILGILPIKLIDRALFYSYLISPSASHDFRCANLYVDLGPHRPEIGVKLLLTTNRTMRIKSVERCQVHLIITADFTFRFLRLCIEAVVICSNSHQSIEILCGRTLIDPTSKAGVSQRYVGRVILLAGN